MSVVSVNPRSFILALFIRDDGERFLLGDKGYDFKGSQLHFAANTIENDEVVKQGTDGTMLAGQVRRSAVQSFDGYVGDATMLKETIEQMRRDFFAFFVRGHHFRVIYVDCNRNAWQRKGGYLVDAPEVKELWQIHPEYHVGLNFEDVNYYSYDEDADGEEILSNLVDVPVSTAASGGLVWDEDGAVSEDAEVEYIRETAVATPAKNVYITDATDAPLASFQLDGETSQNGTPTPSAPVAVNTTTGENVVKICGKNLYDATKSQTTQSGLTYSADTSCLYLNGTISSNGGIVFAYRELPAGTYKIMLELVSGSLSSTANGGLFYVYGTGVSTSPSNIILSPSNPKVSATITVASATNNVRINSWARVTETYTNAVIKYQIVKGSSDDYNFEPYQGQSYEVNLGKNLFDVNSIAENTAATTTGVEDHEVTYSTHSSRAVILIKVEPNSKYTLSIGNTNIVSRIYCVGMKTTTLESGHSFGWVNSGTTITTASKDKYILGVLNISSGQGTIANVTNANVQFEKGSQATSYAAYFEPIELCKIGTYQDYIYKSGDKWYKHKAVGKGIYDGSEDENWTSSAANRADIAISNAILGSSANNPVLCNRYKPAWATSNGNIFLSGLWHGAGIVDATNMTSLSAWRTYLASNNVEIYYALATPTDTEITNEALITQLDNVASAPLYTGVNNITTITPNEQGTLEVSYYTKYQLVVVGGGYVWEVGGSGGATTVINNSIDNVSPIWKIFGPTQNPQLENSTTGETIEYVGMIAEGQTLTIDMGEQTASLDGLNVISNLVGDFISLAPGANRLIYSVLGDAGASSIGWSEIVG